MFWTQLNSRKLERSCGNQWDFRQRQEHEVVEVCFYSGSAPAAQLSCCVEGEGRSVVVVIRWSLSSNIHWLWAQKYYEGHLE